MKSHNYHCSNTIDKWESITTMILCHASSFFGYFFYSFYWGSFEGSFGRVFWAFSIASCVFKGLSLSSIQNDSNPLWNFDFLDPETFKGQKWLQTSSSSQGFYEIPRLRDFWNVKFYEKLY